MTSDGGDLFSGTEEGSPRTPDGGEVLPNDQPPLSGADDISFRAFLADLTYDEVHGLTIGFVPAFVGVALTPLAPEIGVGFLGLLFSLFLMAAGLKRVENRALRYIVREPHYFMGGALFGIVGGLVVAGVLTLLLAILGVGSGLLASIGGVL